MKTLIGITAALAVVVALAEDPVRGVGDAAPGSSEWGTAAVGAAHAAVSAGLSAGISGHAVASAGEAPSTWLSVADNEVIAQYCVRCHSDSRLRGNLTLEQFDADAAPQSAELAEKMIRKLRAGMMPPPGARRPGGDTLLALVQGLEERLDAAAAANPNPGGRTFQRLNRYEYETSIRDPARPRRGRGCVPAARHQERQLRQHRRRADGVADAAGAHTSGPRRISRLAVGDPDATSQLDAQFTALRLSQTQNAQIEGAPFGTRGGTSVTQLPGRRRVRLPGGVRARDDGRWFFGRSGPVVDALEQIEISIDGERVALLDDGPLDARVRSQRRQHAHRPDLRPRRAASVTAAFIRRTEGPIEDLLSPHEWSLVDQQIGSRGYGVNSSGRT